VDVLETDDLIICVAANSIGEFNWLSFFNTEFDRFIYYDGNETLRCEMYNLQSIYFNIIYRCYIVL